MGKGKAANRGKPQRVVRLWEMDARVRPKKMDITGDPSLLAGSGLVVTDGQFPTILVFLGSSASLRISVGS